MTEQNDEAPGPDLDPQSSIAQPDPLDGVVEDATEPGKTRDAPGDHDGDAPDPQAEAELDVVAGDE